MKTREMAEMEEIFGPVISGYSRREAIEDGVLIDVSETAAEANITYPVALSQRVWEEIVVPGERSRAYGQSEQGRLWDILWMFSLAARGNSNSNLLFQVMAIMESNQKRIHTLKAVVDGGDDGKPVITIMLPEED